MKTKISSQRKGMKSYNGKKKMEKLKSFITQKKKNSKMRRKYTHKYQYYSIQSKEGRKKHMILKYSKKAIYY